MIHQLSPPLHLQTPKGPGWAHFLIDYGPEHDLLWTVFLDDGGACWTVPNQEVRLSPNWSVGRREQRGAYCSNCQRNDPYRFSNCTRPGCPYKPFSPSYFIEEAERIKREAERAARNGHA